MPIILSTMSVLGKKVNQSNAGWAAASTREKGCKVSSLLSLGGRGIALGCYSWPRSP